jgi:site-specific recombinase XerD
MSKVALDDAVARAFYVEPFDDFLALEQGASVQTSKAYKLDIARFVTYVKVKGAASPTEVGARSLREYVYHLKDLGLAPASIRRNISAVRSYFKFLLGEGHVVRDPSERLETPKRWRTLPEVLGVDEIAPCSSSPTAPDCECLNGFLLACVM